MIEERRNDTGLRQLGEDWIRAISEGAFERLADFCQPGVTSHLLTPRRCVTLETAADLLEKFRQWFGACSGFQLQHSRVEPVGERLGICYHFLLQEQGGWFMVEQQLYCSLEAGRITDLHLLCSGFQPVAAGRTAADQQGSAHSLLELRTGAADGASVCALLTPAIKARLREMQPGQVLEVRVDEPSARGDIEAWCRLSGNPLLRMVEDPGGGLSFWVQKKEMS